MKKTKESIHLIASLVTIGNFLMALNFGFQETIYSLNITFLPSFNLFKLIAFLLLEIAISFYFAGCIISSLAKYKDILARGFRLFIYGLLSVYTSLFNINFFFSSDLPLFGKLVVFVIFGLVINIIFALMCEYRHKKLKGESTEFKTKAKINKIMESSSKYFIPHLVGYAVVLTIILFDNSKSVN